MTVGETFFKFYNSFGVKAYPNTAVPDGAKLPYITYDLPQSTWENGDVSQTVQIWAKTESEAVPNLMANQIKNAIGLGGIQLPCDKGSIWLRLGSPWCVSTNAENDNTLKVRQLNISLEFLLI